MSLTYTRLVAKRGKGLSRKANAVLRVLADRADAKGRSFPSQETIADDIGGSSRTVWAALAELEACGWIVRERRYRRNGARSSDLITIRDEEAQAAYVAASLKLPLMALITCGKAGDESLDNPKPYSQDLRVTYSQDLRGNLSKSLTDQIQERRAGPPAPGEGAAPLDDNAPARRRSA